MNTTSDTFDRGIVPPANAVRDTWQPTTLALRVGRLRRRHGLEGPLAAVVALLAYGEART